MRNLIIVFFCIISLQGLGQRFTEKSFDDIQVEYNTTYGNADSWDPALFGVNEPEDLKMDIYSPLMDTMQHRPLVIALFGGAFLKGSKERRDIQAWCDSLAHYGYVAAAIDYRLGFNPVAGAGSIGAAQGMQRAAWRAVQDARAAVRFMKSQAEFYRIDTNAVFLLGNSAGAITSLHAAFMDSDDWLNAAGECGVGANNVDLGGLDCSTNDLPNTTDVHGVISLWGATMDLDFFSHEKSIPVMLVHGTADEIVPYNEGPAFDLDDEWGILVYLYGSLPIHNHLAENDMPHEFYPYQDQPHAFYSCGDFNMLSFSRDSFPCEYWLPVFDQGIQFLAEINPYCNTGIATENRSEGFSFDIYPNPTHDQCTIVMYAQNYPLYHIEIFNATGQGVYSRWSKTKTTRIDLGSYPRGMYMVQISSRQRKQIKKIAIK